MPSIHDETGGISHLAKIPRSHVSTPARRRVACSYMPALAMLIMDWDHSAASPVPDNQMAQRSRARQRCQR